MRRIVIVVAAVLPVIVPSLASAQGGPGFLFKEPNVSIGVRVGYAAPRMGGELFDFTRDEFIPLGQDTLSSLDFDGPYFGGELAIRPSNRWDIALGVGWTRSRTLSEYRRWIDNDDNPIQQETTFRVFSGTLGAKYYLVERGRQVGSLAWVPSRFAPFLGAGVGIANYKFTQVGDFVDSETLEVYGDYLQTSDDGFIWYGTGGVDFSLTKNVLMTAEARYSFSEAHVTGSYVGFNNIDLAGLQLMIGVGFQF